MSTVSINDLEERLSKPADRKGEDGELVITAQGQPIAVVLPIDSESLEPTLSALRSIRALRAQSMLQEAANENGTAAMTTEEIDIEIADTRRARRSE